MVVFSFDMCSTEGKRQSSCLLAEELTFTILLFLYSVFFCLSYILLRTVILPVWHLTKNSVVGMDPIFSN